MRRWSHEATVVTSAAAERVWELWSNPGEWHTWDDGIESVSLVGAFASESKGKLKPVGGPAVPFVLLDVEQNRRFKDRSSLPLTSLDFTHTYTPNLSGSGGQITHLVEMNGWLTPLFRRVIGNGIERDLARTLGKLARMAEEGR